MKYEELLMDIVKLEIVDIITTSGLQDGDFDPNNPGETVDGDDF